MISNYLNKIKNYNTFVFILFLVVGFLCYYSVLKGPFFYDDEQFIVKNKYVHALDIKKIYTTSVTQGADLNSNFYRPNQQLAFGLLYKLSGENSFVFHFNSVLFHVLNAFLLFLLFKKLNFSRATATIGGLLFLIHPVQTEAVAYISGFADVLALTFFISGLLLFIEAEIRNAKTILYQSLGIFLYILALFTKESMVVILPLSIITIFYVKYIYKKEISTKKLVQFIPVTLVCVIYLALKFTVFNFTDNAGLATESNIYTEKVYVRIFTFINILPEYLKLFLYPIELFYGKPYTAYTDLFTLKAFISIAFIASLLFVAYQFKKPTIAFALAWFLFALVPFIGIIPLNAMYLEHWLYVPIIGLIILVLILVNYLDTKKSIILPFALLIISVLCIKKTNARAADWGNIEYFYLNECKYSSNVSNYNNLGKYYAEVKNYPKAIKFYQLSIETYDAFPQPHYNLANIYIEQNNLEAAGNELYLALKIDPNFYIALTSLERLFAYVKQDAKAQALKALADRVSSGQRITFEEIDRAVR